MKQKCTALGRVLLVPLFLLSWICAGAEAGSAKPNIVYILTDDLGWIGAGFRPELGDAAVEHLGEIQVAVLIGGDRVRPVELSRLSARSAPPV